MQSEKYGILGGHGFLGCHVVASLRENNLDHLAGSRRSGVDARSVQSIINWIQSNGITKIINLAAECGGIGYNQSYPADIWAATNQISYAVLEAAMVCGIKKCVMIGTVCSYAYSCPVPFKESDLMHHGPPEFTNAPYGVAKLSGLYGSMAYRKQHGLNSIFLIPVNMYGPHDNFSLDSSHVIPALIRKFSTGTEKVQVWGTGMATREFIYVEDAANAIVDAAESYDLETPLNIGTGDEISIKELVELIKETIGFGGEIRWDTTRSDGQPRRCLDITNMKKHLSYRSKTSLKDGISKTCQYYESLDKT